MIKIEIMNIILIKFYQSKYNQCGARESKDTHPYMYQAQGPRPKPRMRTCPRTNTRYHRGPQL